MHMCAGCMWPVPGPYTLDPLLPLSFVIEACVLDLKQCVYVETDYHCARRDACLLDAPLPRLLCAPSRSLPCSPMLSKPGNELLRCLPSAEYIPEPIGADGCCCGANVPLPPSVVGSPVFDRARAALADGESTKASVCTYSALARSGRVPSCDILPLRSIGAAKSASAR